MTLGQVMMLSVAPRFSHRSGSLHGSGACVQRRRRRRPRTRACRRGAAEVLAVGEFQRKRSVQLPDDLNRMRLEELGNLLGGLRLLLDAKSHRLGRLKNHECCLGRHDVTEHVLDEMNSLVEFLRRRRDGASNGHVVPVVVLGERLDGHICAQLHRPRHDGRGERGVAHMENALRFANLGDRGDVSEREGGVRRRLAENELGVFLDCRLDFGGIPKVDVRKLDAVAFKEFSGDAVGAAVRADR